MTLYSEIWEDHSIIRTGYTWYCTWNTTDEYGEIPADYWDGWTASLQIRQQSSARISGGGALLATLSSADGSIILEPDTGNVIATLTATQTAALTPADAAVFDLKLSGPGGVALPTVEGRIQIKEGVTE